MTTNAALPSFLPPRQGARTAERRSGPVVFRGSLERRLPTSTSAAEAECLLPPVGRSEAFAEDLADDAHAATAAFKLPIAGRSAVLRWLPTRKPG